MLHLSWLHSTPTQGVSPVSRLLTRPNTFACFAALLQMHWAVRADSKLWALTGRLDLESPSVVVEGAGGVVMILGLSTLNNPPVEAMVVLLLVLKLNSERNYNDPHSSNSENGSDLVLLS